MTPTEFRTEKDSLGDMQVPATALYGPQTQRAVENFRNFDARHGLRRFEISGRAGLDFRVARLRQQQRQPADFEVRAGADKQVRRAHARDQAGPRLYAMRILQRRGS